MPITYLQCDFTVRDLRAAGECQILLIYNKLKILLTITGGILNFHGKQRRSIKVRIRNNAKHGIFNSIRAACVPLTEAANTYSISVYLWRSQPAVHCSVHTTTHRQDNIYINAHNEESKFCPDAIRNMCCGEYNKQIYMQVTYVMMWRWVQTKHGSEKDWPSSIKSDVWVQHLAFLFILPNLQYFVTELWLLLVYDIHQCV